MKVELKGDIWESLFPHVFTLMDEVRKHGGIEPLWTFGGSTVLMLGTAIAFPATSICSCRTRNTLAT